MKLKQYIYYWLVISGLLVSLSCSLTNVISGDSNGPSETSTAVPPIALTSEPGDAGTIPTPTGKVYYVAVNESGASDGNDGLSPVYQSGQNGPWRSIRKATSVMQAGDITYVRAGVYAESGIRFQNSGEVDQYIFLQAYEGEEVVIDGSHSEERSSGIEIVDGQSYIFIQGLTIRNMPRSAITTIGETDKLYQGIIIRNCTLYDNGLSGLLLAAVNDFLVENVEAYGNDYYGIEFISSEGGKLSPANGLVSRCIVHDHVGDEGHGLAINQGHDITVQDSTAYHNRIHGFDVSDWPKKGDLSYNILFERNLSYDNGLAGFSINSDSHHVAYRNNIAWRNGAAWVGHGSASGFWCYEGCWHVTYENNISMANSDAGFFVSDDWSTYSKSGDALLVFHNNITFQNGKPEWEDDRPALAIYGEVWEVEATHNNWGGVPGMNVLAVAVHLVGEAGEIYTTEQINNGEFGEGNLSVDPLFVDVENGDFHLLPDSPLIDAGIQLGTAYCGDAPDIGVFEYCP
jgi:hypothetical protein